MELTRNVSCSNVNKSHAHLHSYIHILTIFLLLELPLQQRTSFLGNAQFTRLEKDFATFWAVCHGPVTNDAGSPTLISHYLSAWRLPSTNTPTARDNGSTFQFCNRSTGTLRYCEGRCIVLFSLQSFYVLIKVKVNNKNLYSSQWWCTLSSYYECEVQHFWFIGICQSNGS